MSNTLKKTNESDSDFVPDDISIDSGSSTAIPINKRDQPLPLPFLDDLEPFFDVDDLEPFFDDDVDDLEPLPLFDDDDIDDIITDVYQQMDDFFEHHILHLSSPKFYTDMLETIQTTLYIEWSDANLIDLTYDEFSEEIHEFLEQVLEAYYYMSTIPRRSHIYPSLYNHKPNLVTLSKKIEDLQVQALNQPPQKSEEWYQVRHSLLSASNLSKVFGSDAQKNTLIYEKCRPLQNNMTDTSKQVNTNSPIHWGNKYEPVTVAVYEKMFETKVGEFGCIKHPRHSFIGASPDGINILPSSDRFGRMLEIKNIFNREITGIPKEEYWVQTQIQMETCDLDLCDFVETRFVEYETEEAFYKSESINESINMNENTSMNENMVKGVILYFIKRDMLTVSDNSPVYKYMPLLIATQGKAAIDEWINQTKQSARAEGLVLFKPIYWFLDEFSCVLIERNHEWFNTALPRISDVWQTIIKERVEGYEHRKSTPKKESINNNNNNNVFTYTNKHSICLVRLDYE